MILCMQIQAVRSIDTPEFLKALLTLNTLFQIQQGQGQTRGRESH